MLRVKTGCFGAVLLMASLSSADVTVKFSNKTLPPNTTNEMGTLFLTFSVDASGNVVLDATAANSEPIIQDAVNAWDGPVGTISYVGAFNTTFSLELNGVGGSGFRLTNNDGGGLGVAGRSAWRIDRPGLEFIVVSASIRTGELDFRSVSWNYCSSSASHMTVTGPDGSLTNGFISGIGSWDLPSRGFVLGDNEMVRFGNVFPGDDKSGYALSGFTFDVIEPVLAPITVGFVPEDGVSKGS